MTTVGESRRGRPGYDQGGILEIAVEAFNQYGYEATSMGLLAERLATVAAHVDVLHARAILLGSPLGFLALEAGSELQIKHVRPILRTLRGITF